MNTNENAALVAVPPPASGSLPLTNRARWQALGKPEVICPHCWHIGPDHGPHRVCEKCEEREPEGDEHGQHCDACDSEVWWIPECPKCERGMEWTYGEIREDDYARVQANIADEPRTAPRRMNVIATAERMVFSVESASRPGKRYRVDLLSEDGAGRCSCADWGTRRWPAIKAGEPTLTPASSCKHVRAALLFFTRDLLARMAREESAPQ